MWRAIWIQQRTQFCQDFVSLLHPFWIFNFVSWFESDPNKWVLTELSSLKIWTMKWGSVNAKLRLWKPLELSKQRRTWRKSKIVFGRKIVFPCLVMLSDATHSCHSWVLCQIGFSGNEHFSTCSISHFALSPRRIRVKCDFSCGNPWIEQLLEYCKWILMQPEVVLKFVHFFGANDSSVTFECTRVIKSEKKSLPVLNKCNSNTSSKIEKFFKVCVKNCKKCKWASRSSF